MARLTPEPVTKSSLASTTVLGSLLVLVITAGKIAGYDLSMLTEVQTELLVVGGAVLAIIGRFRADTKIRFL